MEKLEQLEQYVNRLIGEIERLTKENQQCQEQIADFPYEDLESLRSENEALKNEQHQLKSKIEMMLALIEKVSL
ncbi:cell division protein ZapB [Candidatus Desantisbacteria bacterium]|nr:cell division protein ZapB [Candidatus Desantisbacteria bacterium]